jgi:hypothetical protein
MISIAKLSMQASQRIQILCGEFVIDASPSTAAELSLQCALARIGDHR